jgi:hypothetical protein
LTGISLSVVGANPGDFTTNLSGVGACGSTLGAEATCTINVIFDPTATGSRSSTLQVLYTQPGSPQTVALSGTGVAPTAQLSATTPTYTPISALSYSHNLDTICPSKPVYVQNTGNGPLLISRITTTGSFSQTNTCGSSLAMGASCEIDVSFTVETPIGTYPGTLTISDNVPGSPQQVVSLSGVVEPPCPITSASSTQQLLRSTPAVTFNISDPQPSCHTLPLTMTCTNNAPATCVFNPPVMAPGGSTVLTVQNLAAVSTDNFTFTATGTDANANVSSVNLAVLLADFAFTPYPTTATVNAGQTATYAMTLTPVNGLAGNIQLSCQGAPTGSTCTVTPATVSLANNYPAQISVAVSTGGRSGSAPLGRPPLTGPGEYTLWLELAALLALLGWAVWAAGSRRGEGARRPAMAYGRLRLSALALAAMALMLMAWAACGGGGGMVSNSSSNPGTPAGSYTITITGTYQSTSGQSASLTHSQQLTLQVN